MKQSRRLSLKSEALAELTTTDLSAIAGAQQAIITQGVRLCSLNCPWTVNTCA